MTNRKSIKKIWRKVRTTTGPVIKLIIPMICIISDFVKTVPKVFEVIEMRAAILRMRTPPPLAHAHSSEGGAFVYVSSLLVAIILER